MHGPAVGIAPRRRWPRASRCAYWSPSRRRTSGRILGSVPAAQTVPGGPSPGRHQQAARHNPRTQNMLVRAGGSCRGQPQSGASSSSSFEPVRFRATTRRTPSQTRHYPVNASKPRRRPPRLSSAPSAGTTARGARWRPRPRSRSAASCARAPRVALRSSARAPGPGSGRFAGSRAPGTRRNASRFAASNSVVLLLRAVALLVSATRRASRRGRRAPRRVPRSPRRGAPRARPAVVRGRRRRPRRPRRRSPPPGLAEQLGDAPVRRRGGRRASPARGASAARHRRPRAPSAMEPPF